MSDNTVAKLEGDTVEQVAFKLLVMVGQSEKKLNGLALPNEDTDRNWILDTYSECLEAVKGNRTKRLRT